ncbi:hypothetical protein AB0H76_18620 [Nocardia sp. NPDC050712]|uniref:hypothetical protein n=1 Tax=Nocardia sp. NPDC050712 TaxID=3155518 RepID=UPI0033C2D28C
MSVTIRTRTAALALALSVGAGLGLATAAPAAAKPAAMKCGKTLAEWTGASGAATYTGTLENSSAGGSKPTTGAVEPGAATLEFSSGGPAAGMVVLTTADGAKLEHAFGAGKRGQRIEALSWSENKVNYTLEKPVCANADATVTSATLLIVSKQSSPFRFSSASMTRR